MAHIRAFLIGVVCVGQAWAQTSARFIYVDTAMNWYDARSHCASEYGTDLAVILTGDENIEATGLLSAQTWVGLYDSGEEHHHFEWIDDSLYTYRHWASGQPTKTGNCTEMGASGEWTIGTCATEMPFLCQHHHVSPNFIYVAEAKNYSEARAFCANNFGTALATILSSEEHDEAHDLMKKRNDVWIGLNAFNDPSKWEWQSGKEMVYTNWYPGEPHANPERCGLIWIRWDKWNDATCYSPNHFMCDRHDRTSNKYVYESTKLPWDDARAYCGKHYGTDLAVILNEGENDEINTIIKSNVWIGGHDKRKADMWEWVDTLPFLYKNWASGDPNNYNTEECLGLFQGRETWFDYECTKELAFVCTKYPQSRNYIYMPYKRTFFDAAKMCLEEFGSTVATILSENENQEAYGLAQIEAWIGLNDINKEDGWTWQSGAYKSTYDRWDRGQPNDWKGAPNGFKGQDCALFGYSDYWGDAHCDALVRFLCDRPGTYKENGNFMFIPDEVTYKEANQYCQRNFGTTLASVLSGSDNDDALELIGGVETWLGRDDIREEGHWEWLDNSLNSFSNWGAGQPDNNKQAGCLKIKPTGEWFDSPCNKTRPFLCNQPHDNCFCWIDGYANDKVSCEEAPWAHFGEKTQLYWAWVNGDLPDPLPYGWRFATDSEFANRPNIYFFGYRDSMGGQVKSNEFPEVCPVNIFNQASDSCNAANFKDGKVTNKPNVADFETLIVHDSGLACPGFTRANGFAMDLESNLNVMDLSENKKVCAPQCKQDYCQGNGDKLCSAHINDLVDPSHSADECMHVYCRDCTISLTRCVKSCKAREAWFGDNLSCEDTCRQVGQFGQFRCFNNHS